MHFSNPVEQEFWHTPYQVLNLIINHHVSDHIMTGKSELAMQDY